jgi:hypothetical protein
VPYIYIGIPMFILGFLLTQTQVLYKAKTNRRIQNYQSALLL